MVNILNIHYLKYDPIPDDKDLREIIFEYF